MLDFIRECLLFAKEQKKYWIIPLIITSALIAFFIFMSQGSVLSPFIYTLF